MAGHHDSCHNCYILAGWSYDVHLDYHQSPEEGQQYLIPVLISSAEWSNACSYFHPLPS